MGPGVSQAEDDTVDRVDSGRPALQAATLETAHLDHCFVVVDLIAGVDHPATRQHLAEDDPL